MASRYLLDTNTASYIIKGNIPGVRHRLAKVPTGVAANVPFNFTVGTEKMPAGEYTVHPVSTANGVIQMLSVETGKSVHVLA